MSPRLLAFLVFAIPLTLGWAAAPRAGGPGRVTEVGQDLKEKPAPPKKAPSLGAARPFQDRQWSGVLRPGPTRVYDEIYNRMRITNLTPPPVPVVPPAVPVNPPVRPVPPVVDVDVPTAAPPGLVIERPVPPVAVTLIVRRWMHGRLFDDSRGRRWILVHGAPIFGRPDQVSGWYLPCDSDVVHFFTRSGRMFRLAHEFDRLSD